jgi:hypothetical protein
VLGLSVAGNATAQPSPATPGAAAPAAPSPIDPSSAQPSHGASALPPPVPPSTQAAEAARPTTEAAPQPAGTVPPPSAADANALPPEAAEEDESHWPVLTFHARILTGFELERVHPEAGQQPADDTQAELFLDQAVVEAEVQLSKRLQFELGFNLRNASVRDAFVNYRVRDSVQLRLGRFKRPFSRLELRSRGKLPFRERGLFNDLVLTESGFAGRAIGAMVWGKPSANVRYSLAAANPNAIGSGIEGVDVVARIVYDPVQWLSLGLNALHKWTERFADGPNLSLHAVGVDARADFGDLTITLEADAAQNPNPPLVAEAPDDARTPWAIGVIAYADYTFKLSKKWTLGPVVVLEWMDTDTEYEKDERVRTVGGLSWNYKKNLLRIMPQVEITRPLGGADVRGEVARETYYVLVSTEI